MCQMNNANCSHYCEFDYDLLEFMCHCPQGYILGLDQQTCQEPGTYKSIFKIVILNIMQPFSYCKNIFLPDVLH